ncbi:MAG: MFS transporter [Verrucomicrobiota bacterium]
MLAVAKELFQHNPDFKKIATAYAAIGVFFGVQLSLQNNFIVERLGIEAHELGMVEGLREVPGFLNFAFLAVMVALSLRISAALSLAVMGIGIALFSQINSVLSFALLSVFWSIGFHAWIPIGQTMALRMAPKGNEGKALGFLRSVDSFAWLGMIVFSYFSYQYIGYNGIFFVAGVACLVGAVFISKVKTKDPAFVDKTMLIRKKYWLYYTLQFLQGCRKQIFITFAIFALVKVHGMPVETTMILVFINQLLITLTGPLIGRLIDRLGERIMLTISYASLTLVFLGYGLIDNLTVLYVLYCLDNFLFFGSIALNTYINRLAPPEDLKPTLSIGVAFNHISSVAAPLIGGFVWIAFGYQVIFIAGALIAFVSLVFAQYIRSSNPQPETRESVQ